MNYKRILVINVARIGDTVLATPAIRALSVAWPEAHITVMGHPKRVEVIENLPYVHEVEGVTKKTAPWKDRLCGRRWDLAIVFGFDEALVRYAIRVADDVYSWEQKDSELNRRVTKVIPKPENDTVTAVDQLYALPCQGLGISTAGYALDFVVSADEQRRGRKKIGEQWPVKPDPLIGIVLESFPTKPYRDWPVENFLELSSKILERCPNAGFILIGGRHSDTKLNAFQRRFRERVAVFSGELTLRESAAVMNELDLYIGGDTGPTHIAGALKKIPMVVLYHCLHRSWVLKPQDHAYLSVLDHPVSDDACDRSCTMAEIEVNDVFLEVKKRLPLFFD